MYLTFTFEAPLSPSVQNKYNFGKRGQHDYVRQHTMRKLITENIEKKHWIECALVTIHKLIAPKITADKQANKILTILKEKILKMFSQINHESQQEHKINNLIWQCVPHPYSTHIKKTFILYQY